ncbi:magnesium and cobalt transport protein CorA [Arcobacter cryaerophilus gv. occultus]|uniref:Magnesium transport protein CorA n=1 Tax=Aliarcobacter cryaerophilus TaxID=28198 RepID=A0A2S9T013_9BACT|nr:magnesium/cobalt transporter CorA [Aliarcobacter cryaerophilus]MBK6303292.1 magnesium/cobalt transporter CorA [Arcobacter sp.]MBP6289557.1 magnesium/cobalt transporter CorA [Aliarcobacter sp.]PRM91257.1 magnesium and cobalt transport protein CorA [Arcobacter cryaerophilus gv. occultus]MBP7251708.1 magnesium/cobalt transporter CorA [Aliarcobacter sp.]PRM92197.1 magnesium and cobalt transport protein CorA [Aliarcobacter cryaerophilus]
MINCYIKKQHRLTVVEGVEYLNNIEDRKSVIWIDMFTPTLQEVKTVENIFSIEFPTKQESEEIELSSRYWEEGNRIEINSYFLINDKKDPVNETVSFILQDDLLISVRYKKLASFDASIKKLLSSPREYRTGYSIFSQIIDIRIDTDADIIEELNRDIAAIRKQAFNDDVENEDLLEQMSTFENLNMKIRENLTDKQRILNSLLKSQKITEDKSELPIMLKDIRSLIDHTNFNFERIDYLQNIFIGLLSVEQNKVIKIFTIVNVIFLPPTLIASIYGMNFDIMPELNWEYGYLFSIGVMILAAVTPLIIFKKKGWI